MARSITPATIRALLAVRAGRYLRGGEQIAVGHVSKGDLPLVRIVMRLAQQAPPPEGSPYPEAEARRELTEAGELVLAAYKLGRSRWGAT